MAIIHRLEAAYKQGCLSSLEDIKDIQDMLGDQSSLRIPRGMLERLIKDAVLLQMVLSPKNDDPAKIDA
jgi:hypothetical protein